MADNDMMLSAEVAPSAGDDDIDIDIDISPALNDEDYILEDAQSNISHDADNDDLMMDDGNSSIPMDDVDVDHGTTDGPYMGDAHLVEMSEYGTANGVVIISGEDMTQFAEDQVETLVEDKHILNAFLDTGGPENQLENADVAADFSGRTEAQTAIDSLKSLPYEDARARHGPNLHDHSPYGHPSYASGIIQDDHKGSSDSQPPVDGYEDYNTEGEVDTMGGSINSPLSVVVTYRNMEYSLIATSDSDDPDTFFLQDDALTKAPLADFFAGLKDVIHEDLAAEDELCLRIDNLSLEISETCISVHETTFMSLIELYESLVHNDGVVTPAPVRVTLGTKPDFAKRLVLLLAGAGEGRGLSEFMAYDESEDHEDASDHSGPVENDNVSEEHVREDEHSGGRVEFPGVGGNEINDNELLARDRSSADIASEHTATHKPDVVAQDDASNKPSGLNEVEYGKSAPGSGYPAEEEKSRAKAVTDASHAIDHVNSLISDVDEDGDLIDYSDDEYPEKQDAPRSANIVKQTEKSKTQDGSIPALLSPCLKPNFCFCTECNSEFLLTAYEAIDETRNQRSVPGIAGKVVHLSFSSLDEVVPSEPSFDHSTATPNSHGRRNTREIENEDDELGNSSHEQHLDREYEVSDNPELDQETGATEFEENQGTLNKVEQAHEEVENGLVSLEIENAETIIDTGNLNNVRTHIVNDEDLEIDYELRDHDSESAQPPIEQVSGLSKEILHAATGEKSPEGEDEINYEDDEIQGLNQSDETLVATESVHHYDDGNTQAVADEINYETDDQQDFSGPLESKVLNRTSPRLTRNNGKRQRTDAEDVTQRRSKQSKRARS